MNKDEFDKKIEKAQKTAYQAAIMTIIAAILLFFNVYDPNFSIFKTKNSSQLALVEIDEDRVENGIHIRTGLVEGKGLMVVVNNCTNCHSAKLVTQNRMNEARWNETIKWMQEKQNLWDLGDNQKIIVDYLVKNYPPQKVGRRIMLTDIDWYELQE